MSHAMMQVAAMYVPRDACNRTAYRVLLLAAMQAGGVLGTDEEHERTAPLDRAWCARVLGITPNAVARAVRELVRDGLLKVVRSPHRAEDGRWHPTVYDVLPELWEAGEDGAAGG